MVCQRTRFSSYLKGNVKEKERKGDWGGGGGVADRERRREGEGGDTDLFWSQL